MAKVLGASKQAVEHHLGQLFNAPAAEFEAEFAGAYSRDISVNSHGKQLDYEGMREHLLGLRETMTAVKSTVLFLATDGSTYAERHVTTATMKDGSESTAHVYVFGEIGSDGKFVKMDEAFRFGDS